MKQLIRAFVLLCFFLYLRKKRRFFENERKKDRREKKTEESRHKKSSSSKEISKMMELHRASFVEWQPTPVVSVKATSHFFGGKCVALARENGDLEMYDAHSWRLIGRVPGKDGDSISRLEWVQPFRVDGVSEEEYEELEEEEEEESLIKSSGVGSSEKARLVSVALDGTVTEWDLNQLKPHSTCESPRRVDLGLRERTDGGGETRTTAAISHRVRRRVREVGDFHGEECRWRWLEA